VGLFLGRVENKVMIVISELLDKANNIRSITLKFKAYGRKN